MPKQMKVNLRSVSVAKHTLGFHDQRHTEFLRFREDIEGKHRALLHAAGIPLPSNSELDAGEDNAVEENAEQQSPQDCRVSRRTIGVLRKAPLKITNELRDFAIYHPAMSRYRGQLLSGYNVDNLLGNMLRNCLEYVLELSVRNLVKRGRWGDSIRNIVSEAAEARLHGAEAGGVDAASGAPEVIDLTGGRDASPGSPQERVVIVIDDDDNEYGDLYSNPWEELQNLQVMFMSPPPTPRKEGPVETPVETPVEREVTPERIAPSIPQPPTPAPSSPFSIVVPPPPSEDLKRSYTSFFEDAPPRSSSRLKRKRVHSPDGYFDEVVSNSSLKTSRRYGSAAGRRDRLRKDAGDIGSAG
ncbi:hypothetical protein TWF696_003360 [Orbilia brochopaga]|uniref:PX domain-containing protein n=1 Tax=Orbilia brochopaga TaxID=3140254 RepID=A0AAV9TWW8_9PEZI